ncbi:hypothetical protein IT400_01230 [Candidatus Nomurabacteria bacterium]|nr:hypothetical protein [Candidatus Nomurabacteria bacterium]
MINTYKLIGIIGLIFICIAMIVKNRKTRDSLSFFGGVGLLIYSIYLKDAIFMILQSVYIVVVSIDYFRQKK